MRFSFQTNLFSVILMSCAFVAPAFASGNLPKEKTQDTSISEELPQSGVEDEAEEAASVVIEEDLDTGTTDSVQAPKGEKLPSSEYVRLAWAASGQRNYDRLDELVSACLAHYQNEADLLQAELVDFPDRKESEKYQALNDVGTCLFIQAEAVMNQGKTQEAIKKFEYIIERYPFSQSWDPRGWYWSVKEKSEASIDVLTGNVQDAPEIAIEDIIRTLPYIHTKGTEDVIDYTKYGEFRNVGKKGYQYVIKDMPGLAKAVGEGIYPNSSSIFKNPRRKIVREEGRLSGTHWDHIHTEDLEAAYFKWVSAPEPPGVRLFYLGMIFEKAEMYYEAIKAYQAILVHFPDTIAWTYWQTPWYPGQAAIAKIRHIIRLHPELKLDYKWMKIEVRNGFDNDTENDVFIVHPGKIYKTNLMQKLTSRMKKPPEVELGKIVKKVGKGRVRLVQYENDHWQMLVDDKPFVIKALTYAPTKIGQSPDKGTLQNWMEEDHNENGLIDGPYDSWVDKNRNNVQDPDEPVVGDFQLMKEMGVNAIRIYHVPETPNKELLREMYEKYGIMVIMGDFLGKYAIGSGADWSEGTDYENKQHKKNMLEQVKKMVMEHKDEPYVLLWLLGNENNYGVASNADKKPAAFFKFANEVAKWIKSVDPNHPVAVNNGDTLFLDIFGKHGKDIDIFSANVYRGDYGFGSFWEQVKYASDKPAFITEYGAPAYIPRSTLGKGEEAQADYHLGNWLDIRENFAGNPRGVGNSLGGVIFEWMDEWWKSYEPYRHDRKSDAIGPFPGGYYFEEWFGIVGQGNGRHSPYMRQLRKSYDIYKTLWNE